METGSGSRAASLLGAPAESRTGRVRLLIAEREPMRLGIRMALDGLFEICAEAETPADAIQAASLEQPEICVVGSDMTADALAVVRGICSAAPRAAVVVLVEEPVVEDLLDFVRAGAIGYVSGAVDAARLVRIVGALAGDEAVVPRSMVRPLLAELRGGRHGRMTARESQVLSLVRRGQATAEIAEQLGIAPVTVRRHVSKALHKLQLADRSALRVPRGDREWSSPRGRPPAATGHRQTTGSRG